MPYLDSSKKTALYTVILHLIHSSSVNILSLYGLLRSFGVKITTNIFTWNPSYFKVSLIMRIEAVLCSRDAERERDTEVTNKLKFSMYVIAFSHLFTLLCFVSHVVVVRTNKT